MAGEAIPSGVYTWMQAITRTILEGQSTGTRSLTYKRQTSFSYDPTARTNTPAYSDTSVEGTRISRYTKLIEDAGAELQSGEVAYQIDKARLAFEPKSTDRIVDGSETFEVFDIGTDHEALYWIFRCRKVAA